MLQRDRFSLTLSGPDASGYIAALCKALDSVGASITDARLARLHGQLAGVVVVEAEAGLHEKLITHVAQLSHCGVKCHIQRLPHLPNKATRPFIMTYRGGDRPGLLHVLGKELVHLGCDYTSVRVDAVTEGGITDYVLTCDIEAPKRVTRQELESMVADVGGRFGAALLVMPADLDDLLP